MAPFRSSLLFFFVLLSRAEELHIVSSVPEDISIFWLPGGENDPSEGRLSGTLTAASKGSPGVFSITTYRGHAFRFEAGRLRSQPVKHSGDKYDLVLLSKKGDNDLDVEHLNSTALQQLVGEMHQECRTRKVFEVCCHEYGVSQRGIPQSFTDKYLEAFSPTSSSLTPSVISQGDGNAEPLKLEEDQEENGFSYGVAPPDEFIVLNHSPDKLDVYWVPFPSLGSDGPPPAEQRTHMAEMAAGEILALRAEPGQAFFAGSSTAPRPASPLFKYPGELAIAVLRQEEATKELQTDIVDQDALKVAMSDIASKCGDLSKAGMAPAFRKCFEAHAAFPGSAVPMPRVVSFFWFLLLWTSVQHWHQCVYLPDSSPLRTLPLELPTHNGGNRTVQAQVLREEPLVMSIQGLATAAECDELAESQDLLDMGDLEMAYVSGAVHSKTRRTLTKNVYVQEDDRGIAQSLLQRFFQAARGAAGYDLWPAGQEPINWLHYIPGYEYRPHCDGGCGYEEVQLGMRVASSLLYCNVADEGGSTIFTKDATKFTPRRGDFLFFVYKSDPSFMSMHAACPVLRGVKSTATQWYREGVRKDWTWEDVNDLGYRRSGANEL